MKKHILTRLLIFCLCIAACAPVVPQNAEPEEVSVLSSWSGDYPVAALDKLPAGQQQNRVGFIGDAATFAPVWENFMPGEALPPVDFAVNLVVFSRNVDFYNRTRIFKVTLTAGVAEILAMETMSAMPIEDKAAMAMAVVPRAGIEALRLDESTRVPVD